MPLTQTISIESDQLKVGELEAFIGAARDAGTGVHAVVDVDVDGSGKVTLSVEVSSDDEPQPQGEPAEPVSTDG